MLGYKIVSCMQMRMKDDTLRDFKAEYTSSFLEQIEAKMEDYLKMHTLHTIGCKSLYTEIKVFEIRGEKTIPVYTTWLSKDTNVALRCLIKDTISSFEVALNLSTPFRK